MYFILHPDSFLESPSHLNFFLSITINHLAFKDKKRVLYPPSDTEIKLLVLGMIFQRCVLCNPSRSSAKSMALVVVLSVCQRRGCRWYEKRQLGPPGDTKLLLTNKRINTSRMED